MTTQKVTYLSDLHLEHTHWMNQLFLWKDEIDFFEKELEQIVKKWTDKEVLKKVEHFQNVFKINKVEINTLQNSIQRHEENLAELSKKYPDEIDKKYFINHNQMRDGINIQRSIFREMKEEYFDFLRKNE